MTADGISLLDVLEVLFAAPIVLFVGWMFYGLPAWVLLIKPTYRIGYWALNLALHALRSGPGQTHTEILARGPAQTVHYPWRLGYDLYCPRRKAWIIGDE
jgi:hypothetical protein